MACVHTPSVTSYRYQPAGIVVYIILLLLQSLLTLGNHRTMVITMSHLRENNLVFHHVGK